MTHEKPESSSPSRTSDDQLKRAVEAAWGTLEEPPEGYASRWIDYAKVGKILVNAAKASVAVGHRHVDDTVRDYARREVLPAEGQLVHDILTQPTDELVKRWPSLAEPPDFDL